jgi:hypothetical protein
VLTEQGKPINHPLDREVEYKGNRKFYNG